MKPATLLGTLVLLSTWSSVGATEAGTFSIQKADNSVEQRIAAAQSNDGWSFLLKPKLHKPMDIASLLGATVADVAGPTAVEEVVASLTPATEAAGVTEAVPGVMAVAVFLGIGETPNHLSSD